MRTLALTSAFVLAALAVAAVPLAAAEPTDPVTDLCDGPNEFVKDDVAQTLDDPTHPQCGSLTDPCWQEPEWGCVGCGPDLLEWVIGRIECP